MISAALAILLVIFTVIKFLADNEFRTFWAWLGLILAIVDRRRCVDEHAGRRREPRRRARPGDLGDAPGAVDRSTPAAVDRDEARAEAPSAPSSTRRPTSPTKPQAPKSHRSPPDPLRRAPLPDGGGARLHSTHGRDRHAAGQDGPRRDAQGRRHHGRRRRRAGADRRGGGRVRGDGARARPGRHPRATAASRACRDPQKIREIQEAVSIPVMAKCRIGHFAEAQILEALEVDYIDESEVLTPADVEHHVDKWAFTVPFVCGATNLGEALRRIAEGAAMIRTKGEAGTGDIVNAVTHMRAVFGAIRRAAGAARGGALRRREGAPRAVRARPLGRRERAAAGRHVHRGRHRDAGRRGALHAARRGRRLRRLGHLQVGPRLELDRDGWAEDVSRAPRRSSRRRRTSTTRRSSPTSPPVSAQPMVGISASSLPEDGAARSPRLVGALADRSARPTRRRIGVLALQGAFREHARALRALGADVVEVRLPERARRARRARHPGRRVDDDHAARAALRARRGDPRRSSGRSSAPAPG